LSNTIKFEYNNKEYELDVNKLNQLSDDTNVTTNNKFAEAIQDNCQDKVSYLYSTNPQPKHHFWEKKEWNDSNDMVGVNSRFISAPILKECMGTDKYNEFVSDIPEDRHYYNNHFQFEIFDLKALKNADVVNLPCFYSEDSKAQVLEFFKETFNNKDDVIDRIKSIDNNEDYQKMIGDLTYNIKISKIDDYLDNIADKDTVKLISQSKESLGDFYSRCIDKVDFNDFENNMEKMCDTIKNTHDVFEKLSEVDRKYRLYFSDIKSNIGDISDLKEFDFLDSTKCGLLIDEDNNIHYISNEDAKKLIDAASNYNELSSLPEQFRVYAPVFENPRYDEHEYFYSNGNKFVVKDEDSTKEYTEDQYNQLLLYSTMLNIRADAHRDETEVKIDLDRINVDDFDQLKHLSDFNDKDPEVNTANFMESVKQTAIEKGLIEYETMEKEKEKDEEKIKSNDEKNDNFLAL
jgi:hypothetical protein